MENITEDKTYNALYKALNGMKPVISISDFQAFFALRVGFNWLLARSYDLKTACCQHFPYNLVILCTKAQRLASKGKMSHSVLFYSKPTSLVERN